VKLPEVSRTKVLFHSPICQVFKKAIKSWFNLDRTGLDIDYFFTWGEEKNRAEYRAEIARKMNKAREVFLKGDYQWFFNVESDIVLPSHALVRLLSHKLPLLSGLYRYRKTTNPDQPFFPRILDVEGPQDSDDRPIEEGKDFQYGDLVYNTLIPFGCLLLNREVVEKIPFKDDIDVDFSKDAQEAGYKLITDTGVLCQHLETGKSH
jgi:hypothetical protein